MVPPRQFLAAASLMLVVAAAGTMLVPHMDLVPVVQVAAEMEDSAVLVQVEQPIWAAAAAAVDKTRLRGAVLETLAAQAALAS